MVAATGVTADTKGAGRAFYSTGTSTVGGGGSASKVGPSFRLGGIATGGKAGGVGNVKDGTALAGGSVGSGNIVALVDEETVVEGGLDKDAIAEVIKRNLGQIRYCYERQLSSNRDLYGKVLIKWMIGASGEVITPHVDTSTLKSAMSRAVSSAAWQAGSSPSPRRNSGERILPVLVQGSGLIGLARARPASRVGCAGGRCLAAVAAGAGGFATE